MNNAHEKLLKAGRLIGIMIVIVGAFIREWLPVDKEYIALILIVVGVIINVAATFFTRIVYVCPECKAQFDMPEGEITLTTGKHRNIFKAALLTCPYCKKTNLCIGKRIARTNNVKDL